jgi:hypothetical protein
LRKNAILSVINRGTYGKNMLHCCRQRKAPLAWHLFPSVSQYNRYLLGRRTKKSGKMKKIEKSRKKCLTIPPEGGILSKLSRTAGQTAQSSEKEFEKFEKTLDKLKEL